MTWLAEYQLFCFQGLRHKLSPVYCLVPHECCDYSIWWIKLYKTGTAIQSNTLSHRYPLIKTKFIIIAFSPSTAHCRVPERNPPRVLSHCLHIFHHLWAVCFSFNLLSIGWYKICPIFLFFSCNSDCPHSLQPSGVTGTFPQSEHFTVYLN